jgi:hypothetical protein
VELSGGDSIMHLADPRIFEARAPQGKVLADQVKF